MDAAKYLAIKGNAELNISDAQAMRMSMANDLRDLANSIESGRVIVTEIHTTELVVGRAAQSMLFIRSGTHEAKEKA